MDERIQELQNKIVTVCLQCPHAKRAGAGRFECDRKRSHCHSSRVRRWLDEIKRLEEEKCASVYFVKRGSNPGEN